MAKVQISWEDKSDNEDSFKVYRGASTPVLDSDTLIATVALSNGSWSVSGAGADLEITSTNTGDASVVDETFTITYTESAQGDYYYGVVASNGVGDSDVATSATSVNVA
jgi:hypothetical protein